MLADFQKPIVVTGGSGFIGSHLIEALVEAGHTVINFDNKPPRLESQAGLWKQIDLLDASGVREAISQIGPGIIYNLAAYASLTGDAEAMRVNTDGCSNLISAAEALDARPLIVHTSTQLVVGPSHSSAEPTDQFHPYSYYGQTKADSEMIFRAAGSRARWIIVRPTNVWGPRHPTFAGAIWKYIRKGYYLHPTGAPIIRSYGYVGNVVEQLVRLAEAEAAKTEGRTFYVGDESISSEIWLDAFGRALTGKPVRRVPMAALKLAALLGELSRRLGGPAPVDFGRLYRMTTDYPVPMGPTFDVVGRGSVSLEEGVARTVAWLRAEA